MQVRRHVTAAHLADLRNILQKQHRAVDVRALVAVRTFLLAFADVENQVLCESPNCLAVQSVKKFKHCSCCMAVDYSCERCQRGHWSTHKGQCKPVGGAKRGSSNGAAATFVVRFCYRASSELLTATVQL